MLTMAQIAARAREIQARKKCSRRRAVLDAYDAAVYYDYRSGGTFYSRGVRAAS